MWQKHQSQLVQSSCSIAFYSLARSRYLSFFQFYSVVSQDSKVDNFANSLFLLIIIRSGLLVAIRRSVCMSNCHRSLCLSFSMTDAGLCIYHSLGWSNLNFLHISQWITLPTQSCLVLYSFSADLLHSLIMWLMVSSLSPHSYFVGSYLFPPWYDWFFSRCFALPLGEIMFLS